VDSVEHPQTLTAAAVRTIRESIFGGDLRPGQPLREVDLSKSLNVSRGTVREALLRLQEDGLVEVIPFRGAFVTNLSARTAIEVYTLRAELEAFAVRLAIRDRAYTDNHVADLEAIVKRLEELEAQGGDPYGTLEADLAFHRGICRPCDHRLLLETLGRLQSLTWMYYYYSRPYESAAYVTGPSHKAIFEAVRACDGSKAEELLQAHIHGAGTALVEWMVLAKAG
jgi:DNA-binding GntR family transcriptional regulator